MIWAPPSWICLVSMPKFEMAAPMGMPEGLDLSTRNGFKTLQLRDADAIGFDLDHTLAKYSLKDLFPLVFHSICGYLIENKGYPASLHESFEKYKDLCFRGLIFDTDRGNVLKLSAEGKILRATHGTKPMSEDELVSIYGSSPEFPHTDTIFNNVNNLAEKFILLENYFDMPYGLAGARVVDILDEKAGCMLGQYDFWPDMSEAIMHAYNPKHFAEEQGAYFPVIKHELKTRVYQMREDVKKWLKMLRSHGILTFMLTSSFVDYSEAVMDWILGCDWREYFDMYLSYARKPGFFARTNPFLNIINHEETDVAEKLEFGKRFSQGNAESLTQFFSEKTGKQDPTVIYVGDSIRSDVFPTKKYSGWKNILILEEMRAEGWENQFVDSYPQDKEVLISNHWGSFFHDDTLDLSDCDKKYPNTFWARLVYSYADIAIPGLEYLTSTTVDHEFVVFDPQDVTACGFYPAPPLSLKY